MSTPASRPALRPLAILLSLLLTLAGLTAVASSAAAVPGDPTGGTATWGIDATYRSVFGTRSATGGASIAAGDLPQWPVDPTASSWNPATRSGVIQLTGAVRLGYLAGAPIPGVTAGNYVYLNNPVITLNGDTGTIAASSAGSSHDLIPELPTAALAVRTIATLDLTGIDPVGATGTITWTDVPVAIAAGGTEVLAYYGAATDPAPQARAVGSSLDPISFGVTVEVPIATTTTLSVSPTATTEQGDDVALTATVAPVAPGTVQFLDGSGAIGEPVPVADGVAELTTDALAVGEHSLTAAFTPADPGYASSVSAAVAHTITTSGGGVPDPDPVDGLAVSDATLVWGYSGYAQSGIFGPWRFFGATGDAVITTGSATGYAPASGSTSMPASVTNPNVVQFSGGDGAVDPETGAALISYDGSFTINAYPAGFGAPDETYADPVVGVAADGTGTVSFDVTFGSGSDMSGNPTAPISVGRVVLATFDATDAGDSGFTIAPDYQGVTYTPPSGETSQNRECAIWGSWPVGFVDELPSFVRAHYYSTSCSTQQTYKPALPIAVGYTLPDAPAYVATTYDDGEATWGISGYLNAGADYRPNPVADAYTAPAVFDALTRLSTWGAGAGRIEADGSAELSFSGTSVNYASSGRAWLRFGDLEAELDAEGNGTVTALVSYANGAASASAPATKPAQRIAIVDLESNDVAAVQDADSVTWTGLDGAWSDELLAFLQGGDGSPAWAYVSTVVNDPALNSGARLPSDFDFTLGFAPDAVATTVSLAASPAASAVAGSTVVLTAEVAPAVAGTVTFTDGATTLGAVVLGDGEATATWSLTAVAGEHAYRAVFVPDDALYLDAQSPIVAQTVSAAVTAAPGSLLWGVKTSFREYVLGGIAHGTITSAGGAGRTAEGYTFPQSSSSLGADGLGEVAYRGSVTFWGHAGQLNLRLADPVVRVTSATSGVLSLSTPTGRVDFATLDLGRAVRSTGAGGYVSYSGAPATLTAAGAASFAGFYSAGAALDPVTFAVGSVNSVNAGTSTAAAGTPANMPDAVPPATEGVTTEDETFVEGGEYTFTADGFQPNETGILAVIYSTPTVLADDLTADAAGAITWTGNLPAGLTGEHTFTFQGSVDRGIVIEIAEAEVVGCPVDGAELDWGFKESFRAYIDGSIANGEWTAADGATYETPLFSWVTGAGGYDAESGDADLAFSGWVRFTGHGGVLDTTIANPRVVIDGDRAVLLLDISGTTQSGEAVAQTGVEFAELDLAAAEQGGGGDLVAFTGIPATLTAAGAAAFGTYPAGEALDPVDLRITVDPACVEPVAVVDEGEAATENASATSPLPWIIGAVVLLLLVAALVAFLVRRARRTA